MMKEDTAKRLFVEEVLERCVWLSYWERISRTIPEELHTLLPSKPTPYNKVNLLHLKIKQSYISTLTCLAGLVYGGGSGWSRRISRISAAHAGA